MLNMVITKIIGDKTWASWVPDGGDIYVAESSFTEKDLLKAARFLWHGNSYRCWWTDNVDNACKLAEYADNTCRDELISLKNNRSRSLELSRLGSIDALFPCPENLSYLPFQNVGIQYAIERKNTLIGDSMGLGKTIQSIGFINTLKEIEYVLIICPNTIKINWKRELDKWLVRSMTVEIATSQHLPDPTKGNIIIMNYETARKFCYCPTEREINAKKKSDRAMVSKLEYEIERCNINKNNGLHTYKTLEELNKEIEEKEERLLKLIIKLENKEYDNKNYNKTFSSFPWDLIIVDECHRLKNARSIQSKSVFRLKTKRNLYLTGTPIVNRPSELFPFLVHLDPMTWKNKHYYFLKRYCGGSAKGVTKQNLPELQQKLRETIMIRRLKSEVLKELPAKRHQVIEIEAKDLEELLAQEKEAYDNNKQTIERLQFELEIAKVQDDESLYKNAIKKLKDTISAQFSEIAKIRAETAKKKIPYVLQHIENMLEVEEKIVFFCHHHAMVDAIYDHFKKLAVKIDGRMSDQDERQVSIDRFQNDDSVNLFVGSITAAGVGITLTKSSTVIFGELDWVPGNMAQASDRCHRIGQKDCVLVQLIVLENSLDAKIAHTLIQKMEIIEAALDRDVESEDEILDQGNHVRTDKKKVSKLAVYVSEYIKDHVHCALKTISAMCDGAVCEDHAGFNHVDTRIGKYLAAIPGLTNKQTLLGLKLCWKYRRQLNKQTVEIIQSEIERIKNAYETELTKETYE